jgi:hypothetical protein
MQIRNNTNGKIITISKESFDKFSKKGKSKFTIISESDDKPGQVVENTAPKKVKKPDEAILQGNVLGDKKEKKTAK